MWHELWDAVDRTDGQLPTIVAGDYNRADRAAAAAEFSRIGWHFNAPDIETTATGLSLDDIALSWTQGASRPQVVSTFSDHHLVMMEIDLSRPPCSDDLITRMAPRRDRVVRP